MSVIYHNFLILFLFFSFSQQCFSEGTVDDMSLGLGSISNAKKITLVFYGLDRYSGELIKSQYQEYYGSETSLLRMKRAACKYVSKDKSAIYNFVQILNSVIPIKADYNFISHVGIAVYIEGQNDKVGHIFFGRQYLGESNVDGEIMIEPNSEPKKFSVDKRIYRKLMIWMRDRAVIRFGEGPFSNIANQKTVGYFESFYYPDCKMSANPNFFRKNNKQVCEASDQLFRLPNECPTGWVPEIHN